MGCVFRVCNLVNDHRPHVNHESLKIHPDPNVIKLQMNDHWDVQICIQGFKLFKMATVPMAMVTMNVQTMFLLSDCNETSQE